MLVSQIFVLLFGQPEMGFNVILLSLQLITSGTLVPIEVLSSFYQSVCSILPATYAAEGIVKVLFSQMSVSSEVRALIWILLFSLIVGVLTTSARYFYRTKKVKEPVTG